MNCGVSQAWTGRSRLKPSTTQKGLLDAVASTGAELPQSHREQSAESGDLAGDATSEGYPLPAKRARSTRTDTPQPGVGDEKAEQAAKYDILCSPKLVGNGEIVQTTRQRPKHKSPTRPHASPIEPKAERPEQVSPATRLRKRRIGSGGDGNEHQLKRARLTQKNLSLFNEMGKKKVPDSTDESGPTKTTSTTTSGFAIHARKNGMLEPHRSKPPTNLDDIRKRYARSRETASPPESRFKRYAHTVSTAPNKASMVFEVGAHMLKEHDDDGYQRAFNQPFTGFPKDVGFNNSLSAPQPDFVEGLEMEEFRPFPVDEHVEGAVFYKDNPDSLTLPHVAGEWKGCGKDMKKATLHSRYDGAALVHARNKALSYLGKSDPPGHAEITTFTTDGTLLNMYAHYATPSEEDKNTLEYHQFQYASTNIKDSYQGHKDGRRGLRNIQDYAKDQSYALRDQLNEHWKRQRSTPHSTTTGAYLPTSDLEPPTATSADEGAVPYEEPAPYEDEADEDNHEIV